MIPGSQPPGRPDRTAATQGSLHLPCLVVAVVIMAVGSVYPVLFAGADGAVDHRLALALVWAMSAGFVRGVGFIPRRPLIRWLLGGPAVVLALALAAWLRWVD